MPLEALQSADIAGGTFYLIFVGMVGASVLLFLGALGVPGRWKTPVGLSCVVTIISAVNYAELKGVWLATGQTPVIYRYVDWVLTIPLQVVTLYFFIAAVAVVAISLFWRLLIVSLVMMVAWFLGETEYVSSTLALLIGIAGWLYILGEIFFGKLSEVNSASASESTQTAFFWLRLIVTIGWAIYPLSYFIGSFGGGVEIAGLNIIYNLADFINKIAFGLIVLAAAVKSSQAKTSA